MEWHWMGPYVKWRNDGCLELSRSSCSSVVRASNQGCDSCLELWNLFSCSFPLCPELWLQRTVLNVSHDVTAVMLRLSREATVEYMAILVKSRLLNCQNIERESPFMSLLHSGHERLTSEGFIVKGRALIATVSVTIINNWEPRLVAPIKDQWHWSLSPV